MLSLPHKCGSGAGLSCQSNRYRLKYGFIRSKLKSEPLDGLIVERSKKTPKMTSLKLSSVRSPLFPLKIMKKG